MSIVDRMLNKFSMSDCKSKPTPCDLGANKIRDDDSTQLPDPRLYRDCGESDLCNDRH